MVDAPESPAESPDPDTWIYVPETKYKRIEDVLITQQDKRLDFGHFSESHLGGYPFWMLPKGKRTPDGERLEIPLGSCPKCDSQEKLALIAQLYVPLEHVDRVTYVLGCNSYNCMYFCALRFSLDARGVALSNNEDVFTVEDDWASVETCSSGKIVIATQQPAVYLGKTKEYLPFTSLMQEREVDVYHEYIGRTREHTEKSVTEAVPSHEVASELAISTKEDDSEDPTLLDYLQYLQIYPNQVARWCPKSRPILVSSSQSVHSFSANDSETLLLKLPEEKSSLSTNTWFLNRVPFCETCGHPRQFEFQILSTAVYLLGSGYGRWYMNDSMASMGTLLVFSCLNPSCGLDEYASDYVAYQCAV